MKGNNKGFTLVELLAVLILLSVIMAIAIPSISASMSRAKKKEVASNIRLLESASEMLVSDYKHNIDAKCCYITVSELLENHYVSEKSILDHDGNEFSGVIVYDSRKNIFKYSEDIYKDKEENNLFYDCGDIQSCL